MSKADKRDEIAETLAPIRNFTISTEDRVRALAGPPAYVRRRRAIEDLEQAIVDRLIEARDLTDPLRVLRSKRAIDTLLARVNDLIERHNRYYPSEANLPLQPRTGALLERGVPWKPLPPVTVEALLARIGQR
jgi:hypothetical protein